MSIRLILSSVLISFSIGANAQWTTTSKTVAYSEEEGKVGIGTDTPVYKLDVVGEVNATGFRINGQPFTSDAWSRTGGNITFNTGKVGIGTNNIDENGYNLFVKGGMLTEKVVVELEGGQKWPDYVFNTDHILKPLSEVEAYIEANKHLPNIPSAEEIDETGINLAEMNIKLLEKIEELTLYLIQKDKQIKALEERVEKLEK